MSRRTRDRERLRKVREKIRAQKQLGVASTSREPITLADGDPRIVPDWNRRCENCGASPIVPLTGMCGPCTFGEADTSGGNW